MRLSLEHSPATRYAYQRLCWRCFLSAAVFPTRLLSGAKEYFALRTTGGVTIAAPIRAAASACGVSAAMRPVLRGGHGVMTGAASGWIAALTPQADAAARIGAAIVTPPVVRSAKYSFAPLRSRVGKTAADKKHRQQSR